ncbi:MAG: hypothetical protein HY055_17140 [Magnetospirillum sp.]|nr:hypothetical protein [Magnetospirillum sp.]
MRHAPSRLSPALLMVGLAAALSGCSYTYTDSAGHEHLVGWVDVTLSEPNPTPMAGRATKVSTLGLAIQDEGTGTGTSIAFGYNQFTTASLRDHSLIAGNPARLDELFDSACEKYRRQCTTQGEAP